MTFTTTPIQHFSAEEARSVSTDLAFIVLILPIFLDTGVWCVGYPPNLIEADEAPAHGKFKTQ